MNRICLLVIGKGIPFVVVAALVGCQSPKQEAFFNRKDDQLGAEEGHLTGEVSLVLIRHPDSTSDMLTCDGRRWVRSCLNGSADLSEGGSMEVRFPVATCGIVSIESRAATTLVELGSTGALSREEQTPRRIQLFRPDGNGGMSRVASRAFDAELDRSLGLAELSHSLTESDPKGWWKVVVTDMRPRTSEEDEKLHTVKICYPSPVPIETVTLPPTWWDEPLTIYDGSPVAGMRRVFESIKIHISHGEDNSWTETLGNRGNFTAQYNPRCYGADDPRCGDNSDDPRCPDNVPNFRKTGILDVNSIDPVEEETSASLDENRGTHPRFSLSGERYMVAQFLFEENGPEFEPICSGGGLSGGARHGNMENMLLTVTFLLGAINGRIEYTAAWARFDADVDLHNLWDDVLDGGTANRIRNEFAEGARRLAFGVIDRLTRKKRIWIYVQDFSENQWVEEDGHLRLSQFTVLSYFLNL